MRIATPFPRPRCLLLSTSTTTTTTPTTTPTTTTTTTAAAPSVLSMHNRPPSLDGYHLTVGVSRRLETGAAACKPGAPVCVLLSSNGRRRCSRLHKKNCTRPVSHAGAVRAHGTAGGLVKARVQHTGLLSLLYQQSLPGVGQAGATCSLDPTQAHKVVPSFGLSLTV
jgi:hypothetical protein